MSECQDIIRQSDNPVAIVKQAIIMIHTSSSMKASNKKDIQALAAGQKILVEIKKTIESCSNKQMVEKIKTFENRRR